MGDDRTASIQLASPPLDAGAARRETSRTVMPGPKTIAALLLLAAPAPGAEPPPTWLRTHQRLCFGVDDKNLDEVIKAGANVVCGGTNAAGIGFAGGPF